MLFQIGEYLLAGLGAGILCLLIFEKGVRARKERLTWFHRAMVLMTAVYLAFIFTMTLSPGSAVSLPHLNSDVNLTPFKVLDTMSGNPMNFWGNILLFLPLGVLLSLLFRSCQRFFVALLFGAGLSCFIEILQLFMPRSTDIDDIFLNTAGTIFGYFIGRAILHGIPFLGEKLGASKKKGGSRVRSRYDRKSFATLVSLVLIFVLVTGYYDSGVYSKMAPGNLQGRESQEYESRLEDETEIETETRMKTEKGAGKQRPVPSIQAEVEAKNACLWDLSADAPLYEKESGQRIAPASTAKLVTALTVLEYCGEEERVTVGKEVGLIAEDASRAWLYPGRELTVRQLLNALLLPSGNDAAYALAVFTGRKIENRENLSIEKALTAFVKAMNRKAGEIGALDSHFLTPDGYDADGQFTTARDLVRIAEAVLQSRVLSGIVSSSTISDRWLSGETADYCNSNELINPDSQYYYEEAVGLKTGKSEAAGNCLVSAARIGGRLYVCVVMDSSEDGRWRDSIALYDAIPR